MPSETITFAIALPPDWQGIDLLSDEAEQILDGPLAYALAYAARGSEHAQLLLLRSLVALTPAGEPLAAGLAVTFAHRSAPVADTALCSGAFEGCQVSAIMLPAGAGVRVSRVAPAPILVATAPLDLLRVQYLIHTDRGLLTITFTTPQAPGAREWEPLFDAMAGTAGLT